MLNSADVNQGLAGTFNVLGVCLKALESCFSARDHNKRKPPNVCCRSRLLIFDGLFTGHRSSKSLWHFREEKLWPLLILVAWVPCNITKRLVSKGSA